MRPRGALILQAASVALLLLGGSAPADAATVSTSVGFGLGHDPDFLDNPAPPAPNRSEGTSTVNVLLSDTTSFSTRFAATLGADAETGGANENVRLDVQWVIMLSITAMAGETWDLELDHSRIGALTLVTDGSGRASARAGDVITTVTGATLTSGSLDLAATANLSGASGGNLPFSQLTTAVLSGVGTQMVTIQFDFQLRVHTIPQGGNGDEASVRMGIDSAIDSFTAGDYPGIGSRTFGLDGQFVSGRLVPEPGTFLTVSAGLLGLALLGRSRGRSRPLPHRR